MKQCSVSCTKTRSFIGYNEYQCTRCWWAGIIHTQLDIRDIVACSNLKGLFEVTFAPQQVLWNVTWGRTVHGSHADHISATTSWNPILSFRFKCLVDVSFWCWRLKHLWICFVHHECEMLVVNTRLFDVFFFSYVLFCSGGVKQKSSTVTILLLSIEFTTVEMRLCFSFIAHGYVLTRP